MQQAQHQSPTLSSPSTPFQEFTLPALLLGAVLSVVMGAANVYLGLKAGMTVSASIPAAVIAVGVLHGMMRRKSILEANLVQTSASAGESIAAGIIFTMPAMIMIGVWQTFNFWTTTLIAMTGGILGILFMIPMRKVFVVQSPELKFPEGVACAEVLKAGEGTGDEAGETTSGAKLLFNALGVGAVFKFVSSFLGLFAGAAEFARYVGNRILVFGSDISPALVGVGFIVGTAVSLQVFLGGCIGWLVGIPLMSADPSAGSALDQAWTLWSTKVRYMGVGAMLVGGIYSILKVRQGLVQATKELLAQFKQQAEGQVIPETERNMSGKTIAIFSLVTVFFIGAIYFNLLNKNMSITVLTTVVMVVMAFFFTAVASYIVGLVGNSNSPVSGMTITTVLATGLLLYLFKFTGTEGMIAVLGVAGIVCCVACTSGDVCNDLKTGYLVGASPRRQQWMQILGVIVAAFVMAPVLVALHQGSINNGTGGIGGRELPAPQAGLFASLAKGFFGDGQLPWGMIQVGIAIGLGILIVDAILGKLGSKTRLHVMPVAVGIYLPLGLSVPIMVGGLMNFFVGKLSGRKSAQGIRRGTLLASGVIAGESIIGVVLGIMAYFNITRLKLGEGFGKVGLEALAIGALVLFCIWLFRKSIPNKN